MQVLGFDPSMTNFGWALHDMDATGESRCVERGRFQTPASDLFIDRYTYLRQCVIDLIARLGVSHVGCESPVFNNLWSEGMYGLYLYVCEAMRLSKVDVVLFSPGQVKAHARDRLDRPKINGKLWKMHKSDMSEAAREDAGGVGKAWNHNEADAYWVAFAAARFWAYMDGEITKQDLSTTEKKQFADVHTFQKGKRAGQTIHKGVSFREGDRFFRWSKD